MTATRYFHTRCNWAGTFCPDHGMTVKAATPREALAKVVDASLFGPLHREGAFVNSRLIAFVKPLGYETADTRHGAIEVIPGRPR
jgi:hypothetical protein